MPIEFSCHQCGKTYRVADSLAGKKVRCKVCGEMVSVSNPEKRAQEPDIYGLRPSEGEPVARVRTKASGSGTASVRTGERIGTLRVVDSSTERMVLDSPSWRVLVFGLTGVVSLVFGLRLVAGIDSAPAGGVGTGRLVLLLVFLPVAYGFFGTVQLARLGYRLTFERDPARMVLRRLFFWEREWLAEDLDALVMVVSRPDANWYNHQNCEVFVVDDQGKAVASLDMIGDKGAEYRVPQAQAALQAAELMDLPVRLDQRGPLLGSELSRAVERLRRSPRFEPEGNEATIRKPVITIYKVAGVATAVVILIPIVRIILSFVS